MKRMLVALSLVITSLSFNCSLSYATFSFNKSEANNKEVIVLLHGLGRSKMAMWSLAGRLEKAGFHVERVGYSSLKQTPQEILKEVTTQINECCLSSDQPVHFAGHSMGGLMIRAYLQDNKVRNLGRVVLMGTPNQGTTVVDYYRDRWWMKRLGPMTNALGTDNESFPNTLEEPYYPVGVIAGIADTPLPEEVLPGHDDGLVAVESTKLDGMSDFIIVETGHSMMRYNEEVARQTVKFLTEGKFDHEATTGE